MQKRVVNVVTGQGGRGHYATYYAIRALAERQGLPWEFQVTDMDEIITHLSEQNQVKNAYEMFGFSGHDLYNLMVKGGWTWLWPLKMRMNKLLVKLNHDTGVKIFTEHWQQHPPDLVVSVMPLYNKGLWQSLQQAKPGTPYITVMTDFADSPPAFWMDENIDNKIVCGTQKAVEQARQLGVESRAVATSGLVVHPDFYAAAADSGTRLAQQAGRQQAGRQQVGLDPMLPTGLVMFGGNGSIVMQEIADQLVRFGDRLQLIFLCGNNLELLSSLQQYDGLQHRHVVGFTEQVTEYFSLADFFIGKPGNVSVSEALTMGLPVITERNRLTMMQEKDCASWVEQQGYGIVLPSFNRVDEAVERMLRPETLRRYQQRVRSHENNAVFEVVALMKRALQTSAAATPLVQRA